MSTTRYSINSYNIIKKTILLGILIVTFFSFDRDIWAASGEKVSVRVDSRLEQNTSHFTADIIIQTTDLDLFNDKVFLSYHVYDAKDKEILWEGSRIPLTLNNAGYAKLTLDLDLKLVLPSDSLQYAKLKFDFVDEKNVYWFSQNSNIDLTTDTIIVDQSVFNKFIGTIVYAFLDTPVIFALNLIFLVSTIYLVFRLKKSELFLN
ncbi:hypothetical protein F4V43_18480 [Paenibacillus spiritus]|uniref:Uncharacterized protein n=1 Tax=Paenibacillus spiritus TaxID=2496557 RepID=A0A5J5FTE0_9BACL|nr:hypothetical protein [Paenibacillus spiritus]KAA8996585.1 hypothetical protein F4V43_18480 [Paenibacillus spiritus]